MPRIASFILTTAVSLQSILVASTQLHRKLADVSEYSSEKSMDVLSHLLQMKSKTRKLEEKKYDCGMILYYHVPGTEGTTVNAWLKQMADANGAEYFSRNDQNTTFTDTLDKEFESVRGWKIVYAQDNSISLNLDESKLKKWREAASNQQCQFVATTMFADTIDHSVSHTYKKFAKCNCTPQEFKERGYDLDDAVAANDGLTDWPLRGQLDYFLFNNQDGAELSMQEKVKRGMEILANHFDVVILNNRQKFVDTVLKVTGWASPISLGGKDHGELIFTKDLVSKYSKLAGKNGDADFIDAVNHVYNNDLGYLFDDL